MNIRQWLGERRYAKRLRQMEDGYSWAAGQALRYRSWSLVEHEHEMLFCGERTAFDEGVQQAIQDWKAIELASRNIYSAMSRGNHVLVFTRAEVRALRDAMTPF